MSIAPSSAVVSLVVIALATLAALLFKRARISSMDGGEFFLRLVRAWRAPSVGPERLRMLRRRLGRRLLIVDLRPTERFVADQIPGALSSPFDDFLKQLVVEGRYDGDKARPIVLVCDTGHMSRVAADIMVKDEGFSRVYSLHGGIKGWLRSAEERRCWCRRILAARCC